MPLFMRHSIILTLLWQLIAPMSLWSQTPDTPTEAQSARALKNSLMTAMTQQMQQMQSQQMMSSLRREVQIQAFPDKYFPQCMIAEALPRQNNNICPTLLSQTIYSNKAPQELIGLLQMAQGYRGISIEAQQYYEGTGTIGNMFGKNIGLQCIQEQHDYLVNEELPGRIAEIDRVVALLNEREAEFQEQMERTGLKKIRGYYNLLHTGETTDRNFASGYLTDSACASMMTSDNVEELTAPGGKGGGLMGILDHVKPIREEAKTFAKKRVYIKNQINQFIENAGQDIDQMGLEAMLGDGALGGRSDFANQPAVQEAVSDWRRKYAQEIDPMLNELKTYFPDHDITKTILSGNKFVNVNDKIQVWRNQQEKACLDDRFADGAGKLEQLADTLTLGCGRDAPPTAGKLVASIKSILRNDRLSMSQKLEQIKKKESKGQLSRLVTCPKRTGIRDLASGVPYSEQFARLVEDCRNNMSNDSYQDVNGISVNAAYTKLIEINQKISRFKATAKSNIKTALKAQLIDCQGIKPTDHPVACGPHNIKMDQPGGGFCYKNALTCAKSINTCYSQVKTEVKMLKEMMKREARIINDNIKNYKAAQVELYKGIRSLYLQQSQLYKQKFGVTYDIPSKAKFGKVPKTTYNQKYGLELMEGLDIDNPTSQMETLQDLLQDGPDSISKMIEAQNKLIAKESSDRMGETKANYTAAQNKWKEVQSNCDAFINFLDGIKGGIQQSMAEQQKAQSEANKELVTACYQARLLDQNPLNETAAAALAKSLESITNLPYEQYEMLNNLAGYPTNLDQEARASKVCSAPYFKKPGTSSVANPMINGTNLHTNCTKYWDMGCDYGGVPAKPVNETASTPSATEEEIYKRHPAGTIEQCKNVIKNVAGIIPTIMTDDSEAYFSAANQKKFVESMGAPSFEMEKLTKCKAIFDGNNGKSSTVGENPGGDTQSIWSQST
jgi:hypothetical protein